MYKSLSSPEHLANWCF